VLLAVPNVSEGRDLGALDAIGAAFASTGAALLDRHHDPDHGRAVFTLAAPAGAVHEAVLAGARAVVERIDLARHRGLHPHVGALDVAPLVFLDDERRGAACAEALVLADRLGHELGLPVLLYGLLGAGRTRADLRRGGPGALAQRLRGGELTPDFGPAAPHPSAGAVLVAARAPLVAFNLELAPPATVADARAIAAALREGGPEGLPGLRAIGLELAARRPGDPVPQLSCNVEDHRALPLAQLLAAVERHAAVAEAELVGLAPAAAFAGWPERVAIRHRATLEERLAGAGIAIQ
jgi:glutamate formiminotransferase/glutamate formiminotransferase/formiminotetrahydrofolate cyclodeaminase